MTNRHRARAGLAAIVALTSLAFGGAAASAHNPSTSFGCEGPVTDKQPILQVDLLQYNGTNHVTVTIDGTVKVDTDFGDSYSLTLDAGKPTKPHTAIVNVVAHDDPQGTHGWTFSQTLQAPACQRPPNTLGKLTLAINGPCEDPMYRVTYRNTTDKAAHATFKRKRGKDGTWVTSSYTIAAHATWRTAYKWVKGGSLMTATIGTKVIQERAAPGGWYGPCPK